MNASDGRDHTIKDFLERPYPLTNIEWNITNNQFTTIYSAEFPDAVLGIQLYQQKLYGFLGVRSNLHFRLQLNAQPFQAGRLIMAWVPYYKYLGNRKSNFDNDGENNMISLSGCPHIDIDISQHTEADFIVPYASNQSYYNLATGEGYYGKLYIKVYSPLVDPTGNGLVDCTLWFNFDSVELAFPTGTAIQSSSVNPTAQVGDEELVVEEKRSFAEATAKFASALRTVPPVPLLESILQPAAWAADNVSTVLKLFGLSKPESSNIPNYIKQSPAKFMANADGVNTSHSLSLLAGNAIEGMSDMAPEAKDEMSIGHIIQTPTYFSRFSWNTTATPGTPLFTAPINPAFFYKESTTGFTPSFLMYVASCFLFWRGSIIITLKLVKTKFHSGRLRFYFQPGAQEFASTNANYNYSQVMDLRSETEVRFTVPYVNTKPWCRFQNATTDTFMHTGVFRVEVLNELRANSSVSSTIDVLVEVSAGQDFELAAPCAPQIQPLLVTSSSAASKLLSSMKARLQAGDEVSREQAQLGINDNQLGSKRDIAPWAINLAMQGEKVLSLRQLLKRSSLSGSVTLSSPGSLSIAPFSPQMNYSRTSSGPPVFSPKSYLDFFQNIFAFWRGSVNIKIIPSNFENTKARVEAILAFPFSNSNPGSYYPVPAQNSLISTTIPAKNSLATNPVQIVFQDLEGCIDITCPYYSTMHMSPVSDYTFSDYNVLLGMYPPYLVYVSRLNADTYDIYRSAADSYQLAYLLGPPLCEFVTG